MASRNVLILRKPRSGCLEGRKVLIQLIINSFTTLSSVVMHEFCGTGPGKRTSLPGAAVPDAARRTSIDCEDSGYSLDKLRFTCNYNNETVSHRGFVVPLAIAKTRTARHLQSRQ